MVEARFDWLPGILVEIANVAGLDAALRLAEAYGGTRRTIPASAPDDHWLVRCVGKPAAAAICAHFRTSPPGDRPYGREILIPLGPSGSRATARRRMMQALERGVSARAAASAAGVHERTAFRMRRKMRDDDQGSLL